MAGEKLPTLGRHQHIGNIEETRGLERRLGVSLIGDCVTQGQRLRAGQDVTDKWLARILGGDDSDNALRELTGGITAILDATWPSVRQADGRLMVEGIWAIPAAEDAPKPGDRYRVADKPWRTVTVRKAYRLGLLDAAATFAVRLEVGHEPSPEAAGPKRYDGLLKQTPAPPAGLAKTLRLLADYSDAAEWLNAGLPPPACTGTGTEAVGQSYLREIGTTRGDVRYATLNGARYGMGDADTALAEVLAWATTGMWQRGGWRRVDEPGSWQGQEVRVTLAHDSEASDRTRPYWVAARCANSGEGVSDVRLEHCAAGPTSQREAVITVNHKAQRLLHMLAAAAVADLQRTR